MNDDHDEQPHLPAPTLWPIGFAIGIASILVGLVVSWPALVVGVILALVFGALWVRDLARGAPPTEAEPAAAIAEPEDDVHETYGRSVFLTTATIGVGGAIGAAVTLPALGFAVLPSFTGEAASPQTPVDLGPIENFPEGRFMIANFLANPALGEVSRRTAYVRYNGPAESGEPSFTTIFGRCVHLGCPVQPNGPTSQDQAVTYKDVTLTPVTPAGFGCPCHGAAYDAEGNRTAGPPVRSLDRFEFSIVDGNVVLGRLFSVGAVTGTGAAARMTRYRRAYPGVHVDGLSRWLYPIPVPGS